MRIRVAFFLGAATAAVFMVLSGPAPAQNKSVGPSPAGAQAALQRASHFRKIEARMIDIDY